MPSWLIVVLFAVAAVAFFMVGLSITLMVKGHFIDSEISTNKDMQKLGIVCAVQETRQDDENADCLSLGCHSNCAACDVDIHTEQSDK